MMTTVKTVLLAAVLAAGTGVAAELGEVRPFTGTVGDGHCFPAACVPFGMVSAGADTGNCDAWDHVSGYCYTNLSIRGFSQSHLNGVGCPDLGDLLVQPFTGELPNEDPRSLDCGVVRSRFSHDRETASPGYYAVTLDDFAVRAEATATERAAIYRFAYHDVAKGARLLVDPQYGIVWDPSNECNRVKFADVKWAADRRTLTGLMHVQAWTKRTVAFRLELDRPWAACREIARRENPLPPDHWAYHDWEKAPRYVLDFDLKTGETLKVKIALAGTDPEGAGRNLAAEIPDWDFDRVRAKAEAAWRELLGRATIEADEKTRQNFATALYHACQQPQVYSDVDGRWRGADGKIRVAAPGRRVYSTFSLWDTYRAAHPLYTVLASEYVDDFVYSLVEQGHVQGYLPVWGLFANDNQCMIGSHAVPVIVDAYLKGFRGFDAGSAWTSVSNTLLRNVEGRFKDRWDLVEKYGWYPTDVIKGESVSRLMEGCYDDHCAALLAEGVGASASARHLRDRSRAWTNVFDRTTGYVRGRDSKGAWREPFDPESLGVDQTVANDYTEANALQYTWHVQHEVDTLIGLLGGRERAARRLEALFDPAGRLGAHRFVTGAIGRYAHGNEPSHHLIYFLPQLGRGERAAELVREVFDRLYAPTPDGVCGNDDCGQMSAWYVFSALGFYPFDPCGGAFVIGAPQVASATLKLPGGKTLRILADGFSRANKYVRNVCRDGRRVEGCMLDYADLMRGGELRFEMYEGAAAAAARRVIARFAGDEVASALTLETIPSADGLPVYEVSDNGRTVRGSSAVAICRGFYANALEKGAGICSWSGRRFDAKGAFAPSAPVRRVSPYAHREYFNVVTYGYTMPYWDEARWMEEIDWMALHGVDMPLLEIAAEAVAERVWRKLGLTDAEIDDYLAGPAHMPWFRMGNLTRCPDKQPKAWRERAVRLQHRVLDRMRELGMTPIAPAFAGFLPQTVRRVRPDLPLLEMHWMGDNSPWSNGLLAPSHAAFREIGRQYVEEWEKEFGTFDYYLSDSFNEMKMPWKTEAETLAGLAACGENVYGAIRDASPDATWVMQGWIFYAARDFWNPKTLGALLGCVPDDRALVLDLSVDYIEFLTGAFPTMNWDKFQGFFGKRWAWSTIPNMGGDVDFTGKVAWYANAHLKALASPNRGKLFVYGMAPEGIENNEVIYELETSAAWRDRPVDPLSWLETYSAARWGRRLPQARAYWEALLRGPYASFRDHPRYDWQYVPGREDNAYVYPVNPDEAELQAWRDAVAALEAMAPELKDSPLFAADLAEVRALYAGREADLLLRRERAAFAAGDREASRKLRDEVREKLRTVDALLAKHPLHRLDRWLGFAQRAAEGDAALAAAYRKNAARLVTCWGPPLEDYSARVWHGLVDGFYLPRLEALWKATDEQRDLPAAAAEFERAWLDRVGSFSKDR